MSLVCPYCRTAVDAEDADIVRCEGCGTPHHQECFTENRGCTVYGCALAPSDEPSVHVMSWDVSGALGAPFGYDPSYDSWIGYGDAYAPIPARPTTAPVIPLTHIPPVHGTPKERGTYILLGLLLGSFGAHNFYAGRRKHAIAQASLTVGTLLYGALAMWIWALLEVCTVDRDGNDVPFA